MSRRAFPLARADAAEEDTESDYDEDESDLDEELDSDADGRPESPPGPQPELDLCPSCGEKPVYPVETDCFHVFCAQCFLHSWRSNRNRWRTGASCRACKRPVRSLLPRFGEPKEPEDLQLKNGILWNINDYNRQFSAGPRLWVEYGTEPRPKQPINSLSCPVCLRDTQYPVETGCRHVLCEMCLVQYWRCVKFRVPIDCLLCKEPVTLLRPRFGPPGPGAQDLQLRNGVLWNVNDYNIQFSSQPKQRLEYSTELRPGPQLRCPVCQHVTETNPIPTLCQGCLMQYWKQSPWYSMAPVVFLPRCRKQSKSGALRSGDFVKTGDIYEYVLSSPAERILSLQYKVMKL